MDGQDGTSCGRLVSKTSSAQDPAQGICLQTLPPRAALPLLGWEDALKLKDLLSPHGQQKGKGIETLHRREKRTWERCLGGKVDDSVLPHL